MRIRLAELSEGQTRIARSEELQIDDLDGITRKSRYSIDLVLRRDPRTIQLEGGLRGSVDMECHRCFESVEQPFEGELLLVCFLEGAPEEGLEEEDDVIVLTRHQKEVDLGGKIREAILLGLPIQVLCSPGCKGLCQGCGANLNHEDCTCGSEKGG